MQGRCPRAHPKMKDGILATSGVQLAIARSKVLSECRSSPVLRLTSHLFGRCPCARPKMEAEVSPPLIRRFPHGRLDMDATILYT